MKLTIRTMTGIQDIQKQCGKYKFTRDKVCTVLSLKKNFIVSLFTGTYCSLYHTEFPLC